MQKTVTVDIDMSDFDTEELVSVLGARGVDLYEGTDLEEHEHLLRHGIEDRDWSKIEEFAEKLDVNFSKLMARK